MDLSGGERQRIAIARALYRQTRDRPARRTDLDPRRSYGVTASRYNSTASQAQTLIVVAHRLKTVIEAYKVLVIEDGRIIESGTPGDLIRQGGLFAKMHEAQSLKVRS